MQRIIFFDGICNLCDNLVSWVFNIDISHRFLFASLQSETAKNLLQQHDHDKDTIIYFADGNTYYYSDAVLEIMKELGGINRVAAIIISLIPRPLRDWLYKKVALNRYRIFGKKGLCRIPSQAEKIYFLD